MILSMPHTSVKWSVPDHESQVSVMHLYEKFHLITSQGKGEAAISIWGKDPNNSNNCLTVIDSVSSRILGGKIWRMHFMYI